MLNYQKVIMKCPSYEAAMANKVEKNSASAESRVFHHKASPVKEPTPIKPQCPPAGVTTVLFSVNNNTRAVHNKENSTARDHNRTLDEVFEDSGYLSLQNSQNDDHHEEDEYLRERPTDTRLPPADAPRQISPNNSPFKCPARTDSNRPVSLVESSTPVDRHKRRTAAFSSTPSNRHSDPNLPLLKFQQAVCDELAKSYQKNKRYDWSIVTKVAEDHLLDRVIGGQMGCEYVDVFSCLLSRNMKTILTNILVLLGDMDLISCKKVSRTWRSIISEDTAALSRCQRAEQAIRESKSSLRQGACLLTRDPVSRVVLSCMQTMATSSTPSSSSASSRRTPLPQKSNKSNPQCTRFNEYIQAASSLKQHESLRPCRRCGSPATHSPEVQRAKCTRLSCCFDFCTHCQEAFHGSTPCRVVHPRTHLPTDKTTPIIPGARSKRSIRRL